jgi:hypothetical protein
MPLYQGSESGDSDDGLRDSDMDLGDGPGPAVCLHIFVGVFYD